jgi:hypothetical protein
VQQLVESIYNFRNGFLVRKCHLTVQKNAVPEFKEKRMKPKRYSVKSFIENPDAVYLPAFVPIFQRWIQTHAVEGLLVDVADYKHVHQGPGVILIGHEGDYALDMGSGRPGLRYDRKRDLPDTLQEGLREVFRLALAACRTLEADPTLNEPVTFDPGEIELTFLDRLTTPNHPEIFQALEADITRVVSALYPDKEISLEPLHADPRRPLTIRIITSPTTVGLSIPNAFSPELAIQREQE